MEDVGAVFMTTLYVPVKGRACGRLRKVGWHKTGGGYQGAGQHRKGGAVHAKLAALRHSQLCSILPASFLRR